MVLIRDYHAVSKRKPDKLNRKEAFPMNLFCSYTENPDRFISRA